MAALRRVRQPAFWATDPLERIGRTQGTPADGNRGGVPTTVPGASVPLRQPHRAAPSRPLHRRARLALKLRRRDATPGEPTGRHEPGARMRSDLRRRQGDHGHTVPTTATAFGATGRHAAPSSHGEAGRPAPALPSPLSRGDCRQARQQAMLFLP